MKKINYIKYENLCKTVLLILLCILYIYQGGSQRLPFEMTFFILFFIYFIIKRKRLTIYALWSLLFTGICGLSILWSYNPQQTMIETRIMIEWAILGNLLIAFIDRKDKIIDLYRYFVIAGCTLIIRLITVFPISTWMQDRIGSNDLYLNSNSVGLYLVISSIFAIYLGMYKNKKIYFLITLIFTFIVILTGSMKVLFMLIFGISGVIYLSADRLSKKIKALFLIMMLLLSSYSLLMTIPSFYYIAGSRIETMIDNFSGKNYGDYSTIIRMEMIETGIHLLKNEPFLGYGIGSYSVISGYGCYSHNNYIELLTGLGILGTFIYYSIYFYVIIRLFNVKKKMYINPLKLIIFLLLIIEYGLVSYNDSIYQILIAVSFIAPKLLR